MLDDRYMPTYRFKSVCEITTQDLKEMGVDGLLLDIDNTLIYDETLRPLPGTVDWVKRMRQAGIKMCIVSNAIPLRVFAVAKKFGIEVYIQCQKAESRRAFQSRRKAGYTDKPSCNGRRPVKDGYACRKRSRCSCRIYRQGTGRKNIQVLF